MDRAQSVPGTFLLVETQEGERIVRFEGFEHIECKEMLSNIFSLLFSGYEISNLL